MRIPALFATLAILAGVSLSSAALAAPPAAPSAAAAAPAASLAAIVSVQTIQGQHHVLRADEAKAVAGTYNLADGQTLRVSFEQRRLFAEVGNRKAELVQVAPTAFAARGDGFTLVFDELPFATAVTLTSR